MYQGNWVAGQGTKTAIQPLEKNSRQGVKMTLLAQQEGGCSSSTLSLCHKIWLIAKYQCSPSATLGFRKMKRER